MADVNDLGVLNINQELQKQQEIHINMEAQQDNLFQNQQPAELTEEQKARNKGRALADKMKDSYVVRQRSYAKLSVPYTSELRNEYQDTFKDKSLMKSRESKIKNKKSRLYRKDQVANAFDAIEAGEFQMRDMRAKLRRGIPEAERLNLTCQDTKDLSVMASLLSRDDKEMESKFADLVDRYAGFKEVEDEATKGKKKVEMSPEEKEAAKYDVMAEVANELLANSELEKINLFDDQSLAQNAPLLERLTSLTAIFNRMVAANPGFMETLNKQVTQKKTMKGASGKVMKVVESKIAAGGFTAEALGKQLERLQVVSDVYRVRKLIVTNPYYRIHYNEELSMNASANASPEQKYLAKLLRTSFYLGKNLQKLGAPNVDVNDASKRLSAEGQYTEAMESRICRISTDDDDLENTAEHLKAAQKLKGADYDKKSNEIKEQLRKERRANTDALIDELEHERFTMPEAEMKFTLKDVGSKKADKKGFLIGNPTLTGQYYLARKEKSSREDVSNENSLKSRVQKLIQKDNVWGSSIGVQSKRLGNHTGGDAIARQVDNFTGQFVENMTDEEVLEMIDGLTYSLRAKEEARTPEQQRMAEDMYLSSYLTYTKVVHQAMRKVMNTIGDNAINLHQEDWARLMSNPRFANLVAVQSAISSNMELHLPYEFLKKYGGQNVEYLKDFYMLSRSVSALSFIGDALRNMVTNRYKSEHIDECEELKEEAKQKLAQVREEIQKKKDAGVPEDSPELRELRSQEAEYDGQTHFPELIFLEQEMNNIEEYRKKKFADEMDDENETNIYELNKEINSQNLGGSGFRELEMLKNSSYWDYGHTSDRELRSYQNSLKSKGVPECYDMNIAKQSCLFRTNDMLSDLAKFMQWSKRYNLDSDTPEENVTALAKTLRTMGYSDEELKKFLNDNYNKLIKDDKEYRERLAASKSEKEAADNKSYIERGEYNIQLMEALADKLKLKIEKEAA